MATGTITSLGIGSSLDLQGILDSLRSGDEVSINVKNQEKTSLEATKSEFNAINAKLLSIKSKALSLSLSSNFIERSISSSSSVVGASVVDNTNTGTFSVNITQLASQSSFQSSGKSTSTNSVYVPTIQKSANGFATTDSDIILVEDEEMTINYGYGDDRETITLTGSAGGMTLDDLVTAINTDTNNDDGASSTLVTASTYTDDEGQYHLQVAATSGGTGESNRVMVTIPPASTGFAADAASFSYRLGSGDAVSVSIISDTTLDDLAKAINDDENNPGVTATIINTGAGDTPYRLVLKADESGEDNRITITSQLSDLALTEEHGAGFTMTSDNAISFAGPLVIRESDGNNDIIFQEDTGSGYSADITATIADGVYMNGSDLADAVETALETASETNGNSIDYIVSWDSDNSKLVIEEAGTLENLQIKWGDAGSNAAADLGFTSTKTITPSSASLNSLVTVDGIDYQRQSNAGLNDIITGVTLSLTETGSSNLTISRETTDIKEYISELITIFNDLITEIDQNDDYDEETDTWGTLAKTPSIRTAKDSVLGILGTTIDTDGEITSFYDLGFEINKDGSISIDDEILTSMISSNFDDIESFFIGDDSVTGMGDLLNNKLKSLTMSDGLMDSETDAVDERISMIEDQIESETQRLDKRYETMAQQFVQLDSYMRSMESQQNYVSQMFSALDKDKS